MTTLPVQQTVFDRMMTDLMSDDFNTLMLDDCMTFDTKAVRKVPLRYRIIALGFVRKLSLAELNRELEKNDCARLYARSVREASLIYAFTNGYDYAQWKELLTQCEKFRADQEKQSTYFSGRAVTMADLREYVQANSDMDDLVQRTKHLTRKMQEEIVKASLGQSGFLAFLQTNLESFSLSREKTRYYFCKYLLAFLDNRIASYMAALEKEQFNDEIMAEVMADLSVFKGITKLKRKRLSVQESREFFESASISCGEIFEAFNYFYYGYVSMDWMQVLTEYYGDITRLPDEIKTKLASSLRRYNPSQYKKMSDEQVLTCYMQEEEAGEAKLDEIYAASGESKGYQTGRAGENAVRKYIKGVIDIDRTTLICFLLFFTSACDTDEGRVLDEQRLSEILIECGFPKLRASDGFDFFVVQYLNADDPVDYLMDEVTDYAMHEENFYLYHTYRLSGSYDAELGALM